MSFGPLLGAATGGGGAPTQQSPQSGSTGGDQQVGFSPADVSNILGSDFIVGGEGNQIEDISRQGTGSVLPGNGAISPVLLIGGAAVTILLVVLLRR